MIFTNIQESSLILVTGGARRIGRAIVTHLHQAGFKVIIHCHNSKIDAINLAQTLNQQRQDSAYVVVADLCDKISSQRMLEQALAWSNGRLDGLINNAACFIRDEYAAWEQLFQLNVQAPYSLSLAAYEFLNAAHGSIINITDIYAESPLKHYAIYCQSKAALWMQTKALAQAFAPNIRVNAIAPGSMIWPEKDNALNSEIQQQIIHKTLLKRHGNPDFIAQAVLSLINNKFITGQMLRVDGGRYG